MQTATVALPALAPRAAAVRRGRGRAPLCARAAANRGKPPAPRDDTVQYGNNWYEQTKRLSKRKSTAETLAEYKFANERANNGKERKDLYSDNWDGDVYKGSGFNVLNLVIAAFVLTPVAGLAFAYWSYGTLWG